MILLFSISVSAESCLYYFHGVGCDGCDVTNEYLSSLESKGVEVKSFEVYKNRAYFHLLENYFNAYKVPQESRGLPVVFAGDSYFIGAEPIHNILEEQKKQSDCPTTDVKKSVGVVGDKSPYNVLDTLGFGQVTGSALEDAFRPGMVALFLILLGLLLVFKKEQEFIEKGSMFIGSVFVVYFLLAFGFFDSFNNVQVTLFFTRIIGVIMILAGIVTIRGFFVAWKKYVAKFPEGVQEFGEKLKTYSKKSVVIIFLGFLTALFSLAGLNDVFFILQSLLVDADVSFAAVPLMLYYLVLLVVPLIIVIAVFHLVMIRIEEKSHDMGPHDIRKVHLWRKHQHKILNVVVSTLLLLIGLMLLFM